MPYSLSELIVIFFTYSVIGWCWETVYCSIKDHHYDYRGFLFGPYCPVYGFAVTTILVCTYRFQNNIFLLFIVGTIVATIFEYVASLFLEKVFHMILWDYSNLWGNIQGRVAPEISLFWGIGVVLLVKYIQPFVQKIISFEEAKTHGMLALIVVLVMGGDFICTIFSVRKLHATTKVWDERLNKKIKEVKLDAEAHAKSFIDKHQVREEVLKQAKKLKPNHKLTWNGRRLLNSYSKMKFNDTKKFQSFKNELKKRGLLQ